MPTSATLCTVTSNSVSTAFKTFDQDGPRYFLDLVASGPQYQIIRRRAPGWNGNAIIRGGFVSQQLSLTVRYQGTLAVATAAWKADSDRWAQHNASITDGVSTWSRCTMASSDRMTDEMAYGPGTTKFFNVRYVFSVEEQY